MMPSRAVKYVPRFCLPTTSSTQFVRRKPVDAVAWAYKWRNMSRVPSLQGRSRSTVGRPLDDYDRLMTSHSGPEFGHTLHPLTSAKQRMPTSLRVKFLVFSLVISMWNLKIHIVSISKVIVRASLVLVKGRGGCPSGP